MTLRPSFDHLFPTKSKNYRVAPNVVLDTDTDQFRLFEARLQEHIRGMVLPVDLFGKPDVFSMSATHAASVDPVLTVDAIHTMLDKVGASRKEPSFNDAVTTLNNAFENAARSYQHTLETKVVPRMMETLQSFMGMPVILSPHIPAKSLLIGHYFNSDIAPSKNRSKRLWKKLRYGTRKRSRVIPIYKDVSQVFVFPQGIAMGPKTMDEVIRITNL